MHVRSTPPPDPYEGRLDRSRLVAMLDGVAPVNIVAAPVGHAKTTLLTQWLDRDDGIPGVWVSNASGDGADASDVMTAVADFFGTDEPEASDTTTWLDELGECRVVVDDVSDRQLASFADLARALEATRHCGLRLAVGTRRRVGRGFSDLVLRHGVDVIGDVDLRLDPAESETLASALSGRPVTQEVQRSALLRVEGWPLGVAALGRAWRIDAGDLDARTASALDALADHLHDEMLTDQDDQVLALLAATSTLPVLDPSLCDEMSGRDDSNRVLRRFRDAGGLLVPASHGHEGFRVHPILRDAVRARFGAPLRTDSIDRALDWYLTNGNALAAVSLLAEQRRWDELLEVVTTHIADLLAAATIPALVSVLAAVPSEIIRERSANFLFLASLEHLAGRPVQAMDALSLGEPHFTTTQRMAACTLRSNSVAWAVDVSSAFEHGEEALELCDEIGDDYRYADAYTVSRTDHYRTSALCNLLLAGAFTGQWNRVVACERPLSSRSISEMPSLTSVRSLGRKALYLALAGRGVEASALATQALTLVVDGDEMSEDAGAEALLARAMSSEPDDAVDVVTEAVTRSRRRSSTNVTALATGVLVHLLLDAGRVAEAEGHVADLARFVGSRSVAGVVYSAWARSLGEQGDVRAALDVLESAPRTPWTASERVARALDVQDMSQALEVVNAWPQESTPDSRLRLALALAAHGEATGRHEVDRHLRDALALSLHHRVEAPILHMARHLQRPLERMARTTDGRTADLARRLLGQVSPGIDEVTGRERVVLNLLVHGLTIPEIAAEIHLSPAGVKSRLRSAYRKLGVANRAEAERRWRGDLGPDQTTPWVESDH